MWIMNRKPKFIYLAFLSILGTGLVLYATAPFGPGVSGDSIAYLSGAESLALGEGYLDIFGNTIVLYPPFYSFVAAPLMNLLNISALSALNLVNAISFGLSIFISGLILNKVFPNRQNLFIFGAFTIFLSRPLFAITTVVAADILFVVFVLLFLYLSFLYLETSDNKYLILIAFLGSMSVFLRYLGVLYIFSGFILIVLAHYPKPKEILNKTIIYGLISSIGPIYLFIFRNYLQFNSFTGVWSGERNVFGNLTFSVERMANWLIPYFISNKIPEILFLVLLVILMGYLIAKKGWQDSKIIFLNPYLIFIVVVSFIYYLPVIFLTYTGDHSHIADDRYYLPLYFPLLLIFLYMYKGFIKKELGKIQKAVVLILIILFFLYNGRATHSQIQKVRLGNSRIYNIYNLPDVRDQDIFEKINDLPEDYTIFTNIPKLVYLYTNKQSNKAPVISNISDDSINSEDLSTFWGNEENIYYLWFERTKNDIDYLTPDQMAEIYPVELLITSDNPVPVYLYGNWTTQQKLNAEIYIIDLVGD